MLLLAALPTDLLVAQFDVLHCLRVHPAIETLLPWCEVRQFFCLSVATPRHDARRARRRAARCFLCQAGLRVAPTAVWERMPAIQLGQNKHTERSTLCSENVKCSPTSKANAISGPNIVSTGLSCLGVIAKLRQNLPNWCCPCCSR